MDEILDYVENTRIDSPDITAFEIAGSKARIDTENAYHSSAQACGTELDAVKPHSLKPTETPMPS